LDDKALIVTIAPLQALRAGSLRAREGVETAKGASKMNDVIDTASSVAGQELRQFVERFERLDAEKKDLADAQKEVMAEAKGRGYDTKVIRKVIAIRKRDANDLAEEEAVMEMYMAALGM
jgi:uncharacterized protein (UPF0335 family)